MVYRLIIFTGLVSFMNIAFMALAMPSGSEPMEALTFIQYAMELLGGIKGASGYMAAAIIVEVLIAFLNSKPFDFFFSKLKGSYKLLIVLALSYISGVVSLVNIGDLSLAQSLVHSTSLSAFLVLANQIYKQFFDKKE